MFEAISGIPFIGGTVGTVLAFLIVISIVVFVHEFGHYIVGRWCGIEAEVFSLGFGPVIWSKPDKRGTMWQLAAIPMGGYVKFLGDKDAASTQGREHLKNLPPDETKYYFHTATVGRRALTAFAGPAANFILSILVFTGLLMWQGMESEDPVLGEIVALQAEYDLRVGDKIVEIDGQKIEKFSDIYLYAVDNEAKGALDYVIERDGETIAVQGPYPMPPLVRAVEPISAASKAGLKADDLIVGVDGAPIYSFKDLQEVVKTSGDQERIFTILRDGAEIDLPVTPRKRLFESEDGFEERIMIGVRGGTALRPDTMVPTPWFAVWIGVQRTWGVITGSVKGIYHMIIGNVGLENLQGPLGIAQVSGETAKMGGMNFVSLIAVISTAIGFINLFPIPVLDGGHLLLYGFEALRGKPANERVVQFATLFGLSLLLTLMLFATFNDIMRLLST